MFREKTYVFLAYKHLNCEAILILYKVTQLPVEWIIKSKKKIIFVMSSEVDVNLQFFTLEYNYQMLALWGAPGRPLLPWDPEGPNLPLPPHRPYATNNNIL